MYIRQDLTTPVVQVLDPRPLLQREERRAPSQVEANGRAQSRRPRSLHRRLKLPARAPRLAPRNGHHAALHQPDRIPPLPPARRPDRLPQEARTSWQIVQSSPEPTTTIPTALSLPQKLTHTRIEHRHLRLRPPNPRDQSHRRPRRRRPRRAGEEIRRQPR